jgi:putative membrane protein
MAALFYLPRLFVYHSEADVGSQVSATFKVMERKLYQFICKPAMYVSVASGLYLAYMMSYFSEYWFILKFVFALMILGFHFYLGFILKQFQNDLNSRGTRFYRVLNEIPTILMLIIVTLVVARPF